MTAKRIGTLVALLVGVASFVSARLVSWRRTPTSPSQSAPTHSAPAPPGPEAARRDWRRLLEENGLARHAPALANLVRPALQLTTRQVSVEALAVGQSRLGGVPDLPARFAWPTYAGKHLAFVAEIDLGEVAQVMPDGPLPKKGHLWFFYAWDQEHWGFDPMDAGSAVVHYEADVALAQRSLPDDIPKQGRFAPCAVGFGAYADIPDGSDLRNPVVDYDDATQERYADVRGRVASAGATSHKLLGYPEPIQGPMERECAAVTNGIYMGDAKGSQHPRYKDVEKTKYDWHLLMQVDSDDAAHMMWGDTGRLYFWIRDQDLRAHRFDKTWMILQCG